MKTPTVTESFGPSQAYHALDSEIAFDSTHLTSTAATLRPSAANGTTNCHIPKPVRTRAV